MLWMVRIIGTHSANSLVGVRPSSALGVLYGAPGFAPAAPQWIHVTPRFTQLLENLKITEAQQIDGETKHAGIRACLNRYYYGHGSETANSLLMGSWGKLTRVRPSRDVDLIFLLPEHVYHRFQLRSGNKQSQLLQEIKGVLSATYSQTTMRGDSQVVVVPFSSMPVEVSPGFVCNDGSIIVCDANDGGRYITSTARAEAAALDFIDTATNGNARRLARMAKQWQRHCDVPLKSFQLERLACEFLATYRYAQESVFYHDWMVRDFFISLLARANTYLIMPGTGERIWLGNDWLSRAQSAVRNASFACDYERVNNNYIAGLYWQDVFGQMIPGIA
ncbi:SMODS domain-containing nucleotidyltransferase [Agrobacterium cavarae]|uniref:SMODS domain-containing nucleotidyltransferase n=1 Tax=Agrobacterium cavarae TaxID=2528239 RepID=UPI002FDA4F8F